MKHIRGISRHPALSEPPSSGFLPLSLGGNIIIFDPSDRSTLYQDSSGATPVTAPGQVVGLMLDKGQGLVPGPELLPHGDFSGGWIISLAGGAAGTVQIAGGKLIVTGANNGADVRRYDVLTSGRFYAVTYTIESITGGIVRFYNASQAGANRSAPGTYSEIFTGTGTAAGLQFGTNGVSAVVSNFSVRELPGHHAFQTGATSVRPIYRVDGNGRPYLEFDGVDDWMQTGTITPGTDKAQIFAGVRKLSDAATAWVLEMSPSAGSNAGSLNLTAPVSASSSFAFGTRGSASLVLASYTNAVAAAPVSAVVTGIGDIGADTALLLMNGAQVASATGDQGTGDYLAYSLFIGRRAGSSGPFNGRLSGLIVRFGPNLTASQIAATNKWMAIKTGVTL